MKRLGYPSFVNMLFAIPFSGRPLPPEICLAFKSMATPMNYNNMMHHITGQPVGEAREQLAVLARENNCKYMFFWDEDVGCPPQTIPELIYKMEHTPDAAAIGGVYCLKRDPAEPLVFQGNGNGPFWDWKVGDFFECTGIGMGCTLIRVEALKDLKRPWFKTVHDYSRMLDGFNALESWTEDLWFCKRVTDSGKWKVYCDASILCTHYELSSGRKFNLPPDSKPMQRTEVAKGSKKILDIGSAILPTGHYDCKEGIPITVDFDGYNVQSDYKCDLRKLPFDNNCIDIVYSATLETFKTYEIEEVLKEWYRVLKPQGELRLVLANFENIMRRILDNDLDLVHAFDADGVTTRKMGFTKGTIVKYLKDVGFTEENIDFVPSDNVHIGVKAVK